MPNLVEMSPADVLSITQAGDELGIDGAEVVDLIFRRQLGFSQTESGRLQVPRKALEKFRQLDVEHPRTTA